MTTLHRHAASIGLALSLLVSVNATAASPSTASTAKAPTTNSASLGSVSGFDLSVAARRFGLSTDWLGAVVQAESGGDPLARSSKGAVGLMQLMPGAYDDMRRRLGLGDDPWRPEDNLAAGAAYLRLLTDRYGATGALAAYNAGPGRYEHWLNGTATLPSETRAYVARVRSTIGRAPRSGPVRRPATISLHPLVSPLFAPIGDALPASAGKTAPHNGRTSKTPEVQLEDTIDIAPIPTPDPLFAVVHPPGAKP